MRDYSCGIIIVLLLVSVFTLSFNVQPVKATGTIYIRTDGSVDPPSAPISNVGNVYYTFMANISDSIVVERDNIVLHGAGFKLEGSGTGIGIFLSGRSNVTVNSMTIRKFDTGINLTSSSGNTLYANRITNSTYNGIELRSSNSNSISANTITNTTYSGIALSYSSSNNISSNTITNNSDGIVLYSSSNSNSISANTITNNAFNGIYLSSSSGNSMPANTITNNWYGIFLYASSGNSISANTITNNKYDGIDLISSSGNSISANTITNNANGILLPSSSGNSISANTITNNAFNGIWLYSSSGNSISANTITNNNRYGIWLDFSNGNSISANTITNNKLSGIVLYYSSGNFICHNNFVENTAQVYVSSGYVNTWDDCYPSGGNYWSDYTGVDLYKGAGQNVPGSDGIGDTQYVIDASNVDHYPLMCPWTPVLTLENFKAWYWISSTVVNSVAVGDVDGDGQKETVTGGTYNDGTRNVAQLVVWNSASLAVDRLTTWYWTGNTAINSVAIGDVDADGQVEIVTGGYYNDGNRNVTQLVVWKGSDLSVDRLTTWYWTGNAVITSVAVGDVDADGQTEIVTGGTFNDGARDVAQLVVWNGASLVVDRLTTWYWTGNTAINSVAIGDVDADGQTEIVTGGYHNDGTRNVAQLVVWAGSTLAVDRLNTWYWTGNTVINSVAIGNVDADAQVEIVTGGYYFDGTRQVAQLVEWNGASLAVDRLTTWYSTSHTTINSVALGDMDGDGEMEIVTGGYYNDGTRNAAQLAVRSGSSLATENTQTWYWTGNTFINSVCLSDINGDFTAEIATGGAYYEGAHWNAQLAVWGMRQTV